MPLYHLIGSSDAVLEWDRNPLPSAETLNPIGENNLGTFRFLGNIWTEKRILNYSTFETKFPLWGLRDEGPEGAGLAIP